MTRLKKSWVIGLLLLLQSCTATSTSTEAALTVIMLPIRIVSTAVGAATGMGYFPS